MQTSNLKTVLNLTAVRWNFVRTVAVNTATVDTAEEPQQLKSWKEIPGPSSLPIIGQMLHFLPGKPLSDLFRFQETLYNTYGPIVRLEAMLGRPPNIVLFDPEACAQVLRGENWLPVRPGLESLNYYRRVYKKNVKADEPAGLVTDHGEPWKKFRSAVNPVMLQPKTIKLYRSTLEKVADDMVERMKNNRDEKNMIKGQFDVEMNLWALESIGTVALGRRLNCFDPNLAEDSPERRLIQCVHDIFTIANELDFKPNLWRYFPTKLYKKGMKLYEEQENLSKYFVRQAMEELKQNKKSDTEKAVLEKLLEIDENIAVIMASDMLFAGVDTAANSITTILYLLAKNPDKQDKLREEISTKSPEDAKKYVRACVKEGIRIMPVVAGNMRETSKEYNILGYKIPKGFQIIFSHQQISVMESQFPEPLRYIPERWLDKDHPLYYSSAHPFAFSPFGFGVRMCIGRRIAELEMEIFLSKLIKNFKVEWFGPPPKITPASLNYCKGPFNFIFKDA